MKENQEALPLTSPFTVVVPEAPELPLLHVNTMNLRYTTDEFVCTLGVVLPPVIHGPEDIEHIGTELIAEPVFRFAVSRDVMVSFIQLMQSLYEQQSAAREQRAQEGEAHSDQ